MWILDNECSRHMTGDRALLSNMVAKAGPVVTFEDNSKGITQGYGSLQAGNVIIEHMYQLCAGSQTQSSQYQSIL